MRTLESSIAAAASINALSVPWHADAAAVLSALDSGPAGLSTTDATARIAQVGRNWAGDVEMESAWRILGRQLASVVVWLLFAAMALAVVMGERVNAVAIAAILVLDVALGAATELRARRAVEALIALQPRRATVHRDGHRVELDAELVVPGDVIALEAGMTVPADARLIETTELQTNEAALTGESTPVAKRDTPESAADAPLPDRSTMVYAGTSVATGTARAVVVATGEKSELGRVGALTRGVSVRPTPLQRRLDRMGARLAYAAVAIAAVIGALTWARGESLTNVGLLFIAVAVAAIPEGLPAVVTITMALGAQRMARRHAIVRRLPAVESLGAVSVVCSDKTGTLTRGEMVVTVVWIEGREYRITGSGYAADGTVFLDGVPCSASDDPALARLAVAAALANRAELRASGAARTAVGDPTEAALLVFAEKTGIHRESMLVEAPQITELPFSSERMLMASVHRERDGRVRAYVKGAPQRVLARCALDEEARAELLAANEALASRGLRVLALAAGELEPGGSWHDPASLDAALEHLVFMGYAGMTDPPAPHVHATVAALRAAGIRTVMLTGDQRGTAAAIARQLGIADSEDDTLDGGQLDTLSDAELARRLPRVGAVSRVSPEGKLRVIRALRARGDLVAMLGDGVNDAPALRAADVGVAMGRRGTDVAREAADVVLEDDAFETITSAVEEGRLIFANIRQVVFYLLASNLAELAVVMGATVAGFAALTPLQILWMNLVTDSLPALALAAERAAPGIMRHPPRPRSQPILPPRLVVTALLSAALLCTVTLAAFAIGTAGGGEVHGRALAFMTLALAQLLYVWGPRADLGAPVTRPSARLGVTVAASVAVQIGAAFVSPLAAALAVERLTLVEWSWIIALSVAPVAIVHAALRSWRRYPRALSDWCAAR